MVCKCQPRSKMEIGVKWCGEKKVCSKGSDGLQFGESHLRLLCAGGRLKEVMDCLRGEGLTGSKQLYAHLMSLCGKRKDLSEARHVHAHLVERGLDVDSYVGSGIVEMYVKCGSLVDASRVHYGLSRRNEFSWTALISGYVNSGQGREALRLYEEMRVERVEPTMYTFYYAFKACGSLWDWKSGKKVHAHMIESRVKLAVFVGNTLIDMYAKCGRMADAQHVFDDLPCRDVVSWNVMILGYAQKEQAEVSLQLYAQMQAEGVEPDDRTFVAVLKTCSGLAALEEGTEADGRTGKMSCLAKGRSIHSRAVRSGFGRDVFVANTLIDMYAKCGSMPDARAVFDTLLHPDVVSWTAMISGYTEQGESELAFTLYAQMQESGMPADGVTFVSILKACGNAAALEHGREIHMHICRAGLDPTNLVVATALVDMYGKCGSMADAHQLFDALPTRDIVIWSALIAGYARHGETELVFHLFERMRQEGIQPNEVTYVSLLTICSHAGLVDRGEECFVAMSKMYGLAPAIEHYNCMVDLFGRAGHVGKAVAVVESMPFQPDIVTWMTLLGACRKWGNVEVGRHAFERAVRLDDKHAGAYILMSSIYMDAHMWKERDEIEAMKENARPWKKEAGQSWWSEIDGMVHTFVVGDTKHPQSKDIYAKLEELGTKMEDALTK